jgi:IS30 family transposase
MKIEAHPELRRYIIEALKKLRSPDEIAGRLKRDDITPRVGTAAIYKWLYSERGAPYCRYLCTKRHRKRRQRRLSKRIMIPSRISLRDRPEAPGLIHAEHDLFVSPTRLHSKPVGLLIVIPVAKLLAGSILLNRKSETVMYSTQKHFERVRADTTLADNGVENVRHKQNTVPTYFCDPGSPWQKPHVEGSIGLIRRWFLTKGTDLAHVPDTTFQSQLHLLNGKYRKSLGYRSAYEVALERGIITRVPRISLKEAVAFR